MGPTKRDYKAAFSPQRKKPKMNASSSRGIVKPSLSGTTESTAANIKVAVRLRPLNEREQEMNQRIVVKPLDNRMLIFDPKEDDEPFFYKGVQQQAHNYLKKANKEMNFIFDHVFPPSANNDDVFDESTKDLITSLMDGYNCSVFAYGATGAGKTHTMLGHSRSPGITYLTMQELFSCMDTHREEREFDICVSYLEIYNENVHDLLNPTSGSLNLMDDGKYGVIVSGLYSKTINTAQELLEMLEQGNVNRTQHPTDANAESSRSHAVFQVYVKMRTKASGQVKVVKLSMIDLAGSERASATGCRGERFKEGANINRSLLALGNCINQLADGSKFIPYRDSKLTRLLKDSLGGNCRTVMIANLAPSSSSYEDTYNTLKYATRANKIQLRMKKNIVACDNHVSQYIKRTEELTARVRQLEAELARAKEGQVLPQSNAAACSDEHIELMSDLDKEWKSKLEACMAPHGVLLKTLLQKLETVRRLSHRAVQKKRAAAALAALSEDYSDDHLSMAFKKHYQRLVASSDSFIRQAECLRQEIDSISSRLHESEKNLNTLIKQASNESPNISSYIASLNCQNSLILSEAREKYLKCLAVMQQNEISYFHGFINNSLIMLKKYYLFLKGLGKMTSSMTEEYNDLIMQAKNSKAVTWKDEPEIELNGDAHFNFILNLDPWTPFVMPDLPSIYIPFSPEDKKEPLVFLNNTITKVESIPIEDLTNLTDESDEDLNATHVVNRDAKPYVSFPRESLSNVSNYAKPLNIQKSINPTNLNSTFVLMQNSDGEPPAKKPFRFGDPKKVLSERTNFINNDGKLSGVKMKPFIAKVTPHKRPPLACAVVSSKDNKSSGFGSSANRFQYNSGGPNASNVQVGCKTVRGKERTATGPYSRPAKPQNKAS